jgi:hypothetical protein
MLAKVEMGRFETTPDQTSAARMRRSQSILVSMMLSLAKQTPNAAM